MKNTNYVFEKLIQTEEYLKSPILLITDFIDVDKLSYKLTVNEKGVLSTAVNRDILLNTKFDFAFSSLDPSNYFEINAELKKIIDSNIKTPLLPKRHSAVCILDFLKKPEEGIFKDIKKDHEKYIKGKHDFLYLTSKSIMKRVLAILEK